MNPFLYQNFCCGKNFCFRCEELKQLDELISNNSNILLYSKRRFGKTSLIKEFFSNKIDTDIYITVYIDLFDITNSTDFAKILYKQIAFNLPYDYKVVLKKLKELFVRVNYTAIMKDDGKLEFIPSLSSYNLEELIADIYRGLERLSKDINKHIVIAFDEFQQIKLIKEVKIDAILKNYMQRYQNIHYIFTGLKRHMLTEIFLKRKTPLYDMVSFMELKPIPIEEFYEFVDEKFENSLSYELFEYIYNMTDGESKLIQEFCYHLYNKKCQDNDQKITQDDIDDICKFVLDGKSGHFRMLLDRLTLPQRIALKAVIISDGTELYTKENLFKLQATKSSLNTAIKYLYKDEIIDKEEDRYYVTNKCFELWCKKKFL